MWKFGVVLDAPGFDDLTRLGDRDEPMLVQAFVSEAPVERV
jgi:hypothetical protein